MKTRIKDNIDNPEQLENIYRTDKKGFSEAFFEIYSEISVYKISDFWKARLEFDNKKEDSVVLWKTDILFLLISCAIAGLLIKIPQLFNIYDEDLIFFEKNTGLIVFFGLSLFAFLTKPVFKTNQIIISLAVFIISALYINLLPYHIGRDSINLAYIHLPLMIWCLYGLIYIDFDLNDKTKRMDFLRYNGDLAILGAIILIAGGITTGVTIGLFSAIDIKIEKFYFDYIVIVGLVSVPIVATWIIRIYPLITSKIAPIIANLFSPIVLVTLIIYLVSIAISGKDPYNDRDFLIVFNIMLLGVMAIVVFSISETSANKKQRFSEITLLTLSIVTLLVDMVALSAIIYRVGEFGFTPNRVAVLGSNLLIFGNLVLIMIDLHKVNFKNKSIKQVETTIANYLPIYTLWTIFVVFVVPVIFGFE